jgi:hypothetical protein
MVMKGPAAIRGAKSDDSDVGTHANFSDASANALLAPLVRELARQAARSAFQETGSDKPKEPS